MTNTYIYRKLDKRYKTSNRAFILRPSITNWILYQLNSCAKKKTKCIGITYGKERTMFEAPQPEGKTFTCRAFNPMKKCEEEIEFHTWDDVLDLKMHPKTKTKDLKELAENISQLEKLQSLKLYLSRNFPPISKPITIQLDCHNLRSSFTQRLRIQSLHSLTKLRLSLSNYTPPPSLLNLPNF